MNVHFVTYDRATGEILSCSHEHPFCFNGRVAQGEPVFQIEASVDPAAWRVDLDAMQLVPVERPTPPPPSYADKRRAEYPPLADFADAIFWQAKGDPSRLSAYLASVAAVKAKYPKEQ